jgi:2-keto-4-pentenoate hydratase/2-oxohepta-3-ene-1,7-dioic acid hydratase in catechol pathway
MLGSVVQTKWVARGDIVEVDITGLGNARARF